MNIETKEGEMLWVQKYRPTKVADTILPEKTKAIFQKFVDDKNIPNLLLTGTAGTGKTTVAEAMLKELECDYIVVNGSLDGGIDTLRHRITNFASSVSFTGGRKYVIIDEADYLTANAQAAFRNFSEEYSKNCGFILTCNFKNRLIEPLHSRLSLVDFSIEKSEKPKMAQQFFKRVLGILKLENVEYDQKVVAQVIQKYFPDFRRVLGELQKAAATGKIDEGVFVDIKQESIDELFKMLKDKEFENMRKWCANNSDQDANEMYRKIYDTATSKIMLKSMPGFVVVLGKYMYQNSHVADPEINMVAFLTEIMFESSFI